MRILRLLLVFWATLAPATACLGQATEGDRAAAKFGLLSLDYAPVDEIDTRAAWREAIDRRRGDRELSEAQQAGLADALSGELLARAESPEAYLQHADAAETTRWLGPEDEREWMVVEMFIQRSLDPEPSAPDDARAALEHVVRRSFERSGPIDAWAADASGTEVAVYEADSLDAFIMHAPALHRKELLDMAFVGGSSSRGVVCRLPTRDVESMIERDGSALAASALSIVRTGDGGVMGWWSYWAWDSEAGAWLCQAMLTTGSGRQIMYY